MVQVDPQTPDWKILWDEARSFAIQGLYEKSAVRYAELYRSKPNIEEAAWEYCKVLLKIDDYDVVEKIIDDLLERQPRRSDYLLTGAVIALRNNNFETASKFYGRVFEKDPAGEYADRALHGLVKSLRSSGLKEQALPLQEQLLQRSQDDRSIIHALAVDTYELGLVDKARVYYSMLLKYPDVEDRVIFQAAQIFDMPDSLQEASRLWRVYLERHPSYLPFHYKLVEYYQKEQKYEPALHHLTYLINHSPDNSDFLLQAGNLCLLPLNRPDKALEYFERYRQKHPEDQQVVQTISDIEFILANDFLAIVENDGAWTLWRDLAEVAPNRLAIYLEMADLLERQGKIKELLEILTIIHKHLPDNDQVALRLGRYYYQMAQYDQALHFLETVGEKNRTKQYYLFKGETERLAGLEQAGLYSCERALQIEPSDVTLRINCMELAGRAGWVARERQLFDKGITAHKKKVPYKLVALHLEMLAYNFLFHEYETVVRWAQSLYTNEPAYLADITLNQAKILREKGDSRGAEQLLRQLLQGEQLIAETLFSLAEYAISDGKYDAADVWKRALRQVHAEKNAISAKRLLDLRLIFLATHQLAVKGDYKEALSVLENNRSKIEEYKTDTALFAQVNRLERERFLLFYRSGKSQQVSQIGKHILESESFDPEIIAVYLLLNQTVGGPKAGVLKERLYSGTRPLVSKLVAVALKMVDYRGFDLAEMFLKQVLAENPDSVVANAVMADLLVATSRFEGAASIFQHLEKKLPGETYFHQRHIETEVQRGRYDRGLALIIGAEGAARDDLRFDFSTLTDEDIRQKVVLARLLWGDKQQGKSLQIYQQLLAPAVVDLLGEQFRQKQIDNLSLAKEHTFWNSMKLLLQSEPEILAELMEPQFLVNNRGSEAGKIVADYFTRYSWQKLINTEFLARTASYNRNYRFAEQSYRRLLEEEDSTEGMRDLATIYSRIGEYRKEAQIYEAMQGSGPPPADLADSIERTSLQLSPQNSVEGSYLKQSGRDGYIDMATTSIGTSFWFTPELDKDFTIRYAYNRYESVEADGETDSNLLYGAGIWEFSRNYALRIGGGGEKLSSDGGAEYIYDIKLEGQLDNYIDSYLLYERKPVYDTVAAVKEHIFYQAVEAGLNVETSLGIAFGGGLWHREYNDNNAQNRLHGYSSYTVYGDSMHLAFRYDYQYLTSEDESKSTDLESSPLYWSPSVYDEHRLTLGFKHDFLGYEDGVKRGISYYNIDGSVGFEDDDTISYGALFDIFLEINPHFLLKGNFTFLNSDVYEETGLSLSLHYRW
ncbi:MAG: tetratricopeptide repeat protein [Desulforhopalus sp.]